MTPVSNFLISPNFLVVQFTDISTGTPTSWLWDFGDSTTSTAQNPSHTYTAGTYTVKLTVTNTDGSSHLQRQLVVSTLPVLPIGLMAFLNLNLPADIPITTEQKEAAIAQWQLFIQPLVIPAVNANDTFLESAYPPLANALIALLAAYSIINASAIGSGTYALYTGNGNSGLIKKVVTGPSEVEYQDVGIAQKSFFSKDGIMSILSQQICSLSSRLMIFLPMCPPLPDPKLIPLKAGRLPNNSNYPLVGNLNWFTCPYNIPLIY